MDRLAKHREGRCRFRLPGFPITSAPVQDYAGLSRSKARKTYRVCEYLAPPLRAASSIIAATSAGLDW
jgi:hypothetical protein